MATNLIVYAGSKFGNAKKSLVERSAKKQGFPSTAEFVWSAIRAALDNDSKTKLEKIEAQENQ
jgi:hypothetical protein